MPTVSIAGRKLFYREAGQGLPVLLFHGFPFTSESFWPQLDAPPKGCRLIAPDHRGFGLSERGPGVSTMEELATDGAALLDALKAALGGHRRGVDGRLRVARLREEVPEPDQGAAACSTRRPRPTTRPAGRGGRRRRRTPRPTG